MVTLYIDGCSWTAGAGLPEGNSLADWIKKLNPSITTTDFSYVGKSNDSMVADALLNYNTVTNCDFCLIGLSTPYRFNTHTDDDFRIDYLPTQIGSIIGQDQKRQLETDVENVDQIKNLGKFYFLVNNEKHYQLRMLQCYYALVGILKSKARFFNIFPYQDSIYKQHLDRQLWIGNYNTRPFDEDHYLADGHLNLKGMEQLAQLILTTIEK